MAEYTFPNQKIVRINREKASNNFLGIKNENWYAASRDLGATALRLYLYLASNANGYNLALSPAAIEVDIGIPRSTYRDQFKALVKKGYLVETKGNQYEFYEVPQPAAVQTKEKALSATVQNIDEMPADNIGQPEAVQNVSGDVIEINNIMKPDTVEINNELKNPGIDIKIPEVKEIVIKRPEATGKKRPVCIDKSKREEFIF